MIKEYKGEMKGQRGLIEDEFRKLFIKKIEEKIEVRAPLQSAQKSLQIFKI